MTTKLNVLGLIEVTSQRQANNGTQCFHDPISGCDYLSYESGYVRRRIPTRSSYIRIYQLNKRKITRKESSWRKDLMIESVERIMEMNPTIRLEIIAKSTVSYRNYLKK